MRKHPVDTNRNLASEPTVKTGDFKNLTKILGYRFNDSNLLMRALTHRSADAKHNETLEFLGDSVLSVIVSTYLYQEFPEASEGELTVKRSQIVNNSVALFKVAEQIGFREFIVIDKSFFRLGEKAWQNLLANVLEALIGAIYLDGGYRAAASFFKLHFAFILDQVNEVNRVNFKSLLQEYLQGHAEPLPEYETIEVDGSDHEPKFTVTCTVKVLQEPVLGKGMTVKEAEQIAAGRAYELLCGRSS